MNEIQIFNNPEFGDIRTVIIDDEPWFVGVDIAKALGYKKPTGAVTNNVDEGDSLREGVTDANGHKQTAIVINESGLYSLIFNSKLDSAKRFKKWVTSEVLPTIRRTGTYSVAQLPQSSMELLELHYKALKEVDGKVNALSDDLSTVRKDLEDFKNDMPILGMEESKITTAVKRKGVECLGGKESNAYNDRSVRGRLYSDLHNQLRREFGVSTYKAIKRNQTDTAVSIIQCYVPPLVLSETINTLNAQQTLSM